MTTLLDYTDAEFPNHNAEVWGPQGWELRLRNDRVERSGLGQAVRVDDSEGTDLTLSAHTVVAHVVGAPDGLNLMEVMLSSGWPRRLSAVLVYPGAPSVVPGQPEDRQGVVDLPKRRLAAAALVGAVIIGIAAGFAATALADSVVVGVIVGLFAAFLGAFLGGMFGGGARFAGERAWSQPQVPGHSIAVVAAFAETEVEANEVARLMEPSLPDAIRIVNATGAWHSPDT